MRLLRSLIIAMFLVIGLGIIIALFITYFRQAQPNLIRFIIGFVLPVAYVFLGITIEAVVGDKRRNGTHKYLIAYKTNNGENDPIIYQGPLNLNRVKQKIVEEHSQQSPAEKIQNIIELQPNWLETNLSVDLIVSAISAVVISNFSLATQSSRNADVTDTLTRSIIVLSLLTFSSIVIIFLLRQSQEIENPIDRRLLIWVSNVFGFIALLASFNVLGEAIIQ